MVSQTDRKKLPIRKDLDILRCEERRGGSRFGFLAPAGSFRREATKPLHVSVPEARKTDWPDAGGESDGRHFEERHVKVEAVLEVEEQIHSAARPCSHFLHTHLLVPVFNSTVETPQRLKKVDELDGLNFYPKLFFWLITFYQFLAMHFQDGLLF
jgi:hypothetical protein